MMAGGERAQTHIHVHAAAERYAGRTASHAGAAGAAYRRVQHTGGRSNEQRTHNAGAAADAQRGYSERIHTRMTRHRAGGTASRAHKRIIMITLAAKNDKRISISMAGNETKRGDAARDEARRWGGGLKEGGGLLGWRRRAGGDCGGGREVGQGIAGGEERGLGIREERKEGRRGRAGRGGRRGRRKEGFWGLWEEGGRRGGGLREGRRGQRIAEEGGRRGGGGAEERHGDWGLGKSERKEKRTDRTGGQEGQDGETREERRAQGGRKEVEWGESCAGIGSAERESAEVGAEREQRERRAESGMWKAESTLAGRLGAVTASSRLEKEMAAERRVIRLGVESDNESGRRVDEERGVWGTKCAGKMRGKEGAGRYGKKVRKGDGAESGERPAKEFTSDTHTTHTQNQRQPRSISETRKVLRRRRRRWRCGVRGAKGEGCWGRAAIVARGRWTGSEQGGASDVAGARVRVESGRRRSGDQILVSSESKVERDQRLSYNRNLPGIQRDPFKSPSR
ncbi:hypothetical protein C8R44DRAFT_855746 [Mycena epipterygia]|nr:hypothetical protein C8R44DRAFT_855746 [Mycena epipterygia]